MTTTSPSALRTFQIDSTHSEVAFQVRHLITKVRGRFADFGGTIAFSPEAPDESTVALTIQAASIDTAQPDRDTHLRSADFFETDVHPQITFTSTGLRPTSGSDYEVEGTLTMHGVAQPVKAAVTYLGTAKDPWGNERLAFEATATVNRKDYGLNWNAALETGGFLVGDEVTIMVSVQAIGA